MIFYIPEFPPTHAEEVKHVDNNHKNNWPTVRYIADGFRHAQKPRCPASAAQAATADIQPDVRIVISVNQKQQIYVTQRNQTTHTHKQTKKLAE